MERGQLISVWMEDGVVYYRNFSHKCALGIIDTDGQIWVGGRKLYPIDIEFMDL